jgi:SAM-dependent methyltransferase
MHSLIIARSFDFGYTWPWAYGHLVLAVVLAAAAALFRWRVRAVWPTAVLAVAAAWALAGFLVVQYVFRIDLPLELPTARFFEKGVGRVLDVGSGSGRSTLMVLQARPEALVVALDDWSADYIAGNGPDLLRANARAAGVDTRLEVATADMRKLPFANGEFAAVVSTYAIDHLPRKDIPAALEEVRRVVRTGGDFLLLVMNGDGWTRFVYGPLAAHHGYGRSTDVWADWLAEAGFEVLEQGHPPATAYFLARAVPVAAPSGPAPALPALPDAGANE